MSILSDEMRTMLVDSASKFISSEYDFDSRQKLAASEPGYSESHWQTFAELGWLAIPFAEEFGGMGGSLADMAGLAEQLGYGIALEPWFASVALAGQAIANSSNQALRDQLIPPLIAGKTILAMAWEERNSGANPLSIETQAIRNGDNFVITGSKCLVQAAPQANAYVVSAKLDDRIGLFYLPADTQGLELSSYRLVDGSRAGDIKLDKVTVNSSALLVEEADQLLKQVTANAAYLACAEALGSMEKLLQTTADYMKDRKQFGQPIANFQALRHFLADMYVILKKTRCYHEVCTEALHSNGSLSEEQLAVLKVQTSRAAQHISRQAIQIHGGIGMTDELDVGHYVKRLTVLDALLGNGRYHLQALAG